MSKWLLLACLLLPLSARADPASTINTPPPASIPSAQTIPAESGKPPVSNSQLSPEQQLRMCDDLLPARIVAAGKLISTLLSVRKLMDGELRDVSVYKSSGDADFDQAAIVCASRLHQSGQPDRINKPVEYTSVMAVGWQPRWHFLEFGASPNGQPHICAPSQWYPAAAIRSHSEGDIELSYVVATDGSIKNLKVTQSTGNSDLDQASIDCVSSWRFFPRFQNGQPYEFDGKTRMRWRLSP
jgi:TonB family protein